jgi:hypothetical protein
MFTLSRETNFRIILFILFAIIVIAIALSYTIGTRSAATSLGSYPATEVGLGGNMTVTPSSPPVGTLRLVAYSDTNFKGTLTADPTTGVIRVTNAHPAGVFPVTVVSFESGGNSSTGFAITVANTATCSNAALAAAANIGTAAGPRQAVIADLDRDGDQDVATADFGGSGVSIALNNGTGGLTYTSTRTVGTNPNSVAVGDLNGDGKQDLVTANYYDGNISVLIGDGAGGFASSVNYEAGAYPYWVALGDVNSDSKLDAVVAISSTPMVAIMLGNGTGGFGAATLVPVASGPNSVAFGDFNNDGKKDIVTANTATSNISVLIGNGSGGFASPANFPVGSDPIYAAVADVNLDGDQDVLTANRISGDITLRLGDGSGGFGPAASLAVGLAPNHVAVGDINGDGLQDIATADTSSNQVSVRLGDGAGGFAAATVYAVGNSPFSVAFGELNGDGRMDLVAANSGSHTVSILLNECQTVCTTPPAGRVSWWRGNDSPIDSVGGNSGALINGATFTNGMVGRAFSFNGADQYVNIPDSPSLRPTNGLTLEGWIKFNNSAAQSAMISKPFVSGSANSYVIWRQGVSLYAGTSSGSIGAPFTPTAGRWYHMAFTYDSTTHVHRLYVDGSIIATATYEANITYDAAPLLIGTDKDNGQAVLQLDGAVDEVGIYGRPLSTVEIQTIYNASNAGVCACSPIPANIAGWWTGNGSPADSAASHHGEVSGSVAFAAGKVDQAFGFDGSQSYVFAPNTTNIAGGPQATYQAWVRPTAISNVGEYLAVFGVGDSTLPVWDPQQCRLLYYNLSGAPNFYFDCGINNNPQSHIERVTAHSYAPGNWYFVTATVNDGNIDIYVNGVPDNGGGVTAAGAAINTNSYKYVWIGGQVRNDRSLVNATFNGQIDEVEILTRALSPAEIQATYDARSAGNCRSCIQAPANESNRWTGNGHANDVIGTSHGDLVNGAAIVSGRVGEAFSFDGTDDFVSVNNHGQLDFRANNFSIAFWARLQSLASIQTLFHKVSGTGNSPNDPSYFVEFVAPNALRFRVGSDLSSYNDLEVPTSLSAGTWFHVTAVRNGNINELFLNGVSIGSQSGTSAFDTGVGGATAIGRCLSGPGCVRFVNGEIDEVTIFQRALSAIEIAAIYDTGGLGVCAPVYPQPKPQFDFDGDLKADVSVFRPSGGEWWILKSGGGSFATQFGAATDKVVPADFTGDGKTDIAYWRPSGGFWYVLRSEDFTYYAFPFGGTGDIPAPADYDGDGKADAAVFRPTNTTWYMSWSTGPIRIRQFGLAGDMPVPGDYDGDRLADLAVFRPGGSNGAEWWISQSSGGVFATQFGQPSNKAVAADFTGDKRTDIAVWDQASGFWYVLRSDDLSYYAFPFGAAGDMPIAGDFDGDGKADPGVFRPASANWYVNRSTAGILIQQFGQTGDIPLENTFVR